MSRLYWPQSTSPRRTWDADAPLTFHTLLPISSAPEPQKPCFAYITNKIAETESGDLEVVRATLQFGLDSYEQPTSQLSVSGTKGKVVCKVAHEDYMLDELKEEANLYAGALAPLQGTVVCPSATGTLWATRATALSAYLSRRTAATPRGRS